MAAKKSQKESASNKAASEKSKGKKGEKKDKIKKDDEKNSVEKVSAKKGDKKESSKKGKKKESVKKAEKKDSAKKSNKKDSGKKSKAKKNEKKASAKKDGTKKSSSKKVSKEMRDQSVVDPASLLISDSLHDEIISTPRLQSPAPLVLSRELSEQKPPVQSKKSSTQKTLAVIAGLILISVFAFLIGHSNSTIPKPTIPTATPSSIVTPSSSPSPSDSTIVSPSPSATASTPPTPAASSSPTTSATDLPPVGISAFFNSTGATIIWSVDKRASGVTAYKIERSSNGGAFKLIATVPGTQHSHNVIETDTNGWSSFRVSAVYSDGAIVAGKTFGLPSQYS